jgi:integrase
MAKVIQRVWTSGPRQVRRTAWGFDAQVGGKQTRKFKRTWTRADAHAAMLAAITKPESPAGASRTLGQLVDEYLTYKQDAGKRSLKEDRRILKTRILPAFRADTPTRDISGAAIAQYERRRLGEVSAYTVANELTVLRHMLRLARRWGYIDQVPDVEMPRRPEGRTRFLDEAEIVRLLHACAEAKGRNPYLPAIVTIAINTGMRKAEILELEWERVDLSTGRLTLYRTKSGKPRGVPMNTAVYDALVGIQSDPEQRRGLVFQKRDARAWGQIRTAFQNALDRAGIKGVRFHDLRHTAASHMVMRGASLKDVQEVLGHADIKMTMRYAHLSPAHLRATVDRLDGLTPSVSTKSAQNAVDSGKRLVNPYAPVAQVDRAAVS